MYNGERIYYRNSPYYIAGKLDERMYLIETKPDSGDRICAVKEGDHYLNLISGETFNLDDDLTEGQATFYLATIYKEWFMLF